MKNLKFLLSTVKRESPFLFIVSIVLLVLAVACIPAMIIDDRILLGISVWTKPFKFSLSTAIYMLTVGFLTTLYPFSKRKRKFINGTVAFTLMIEMTIIFYQGARGVRSHFNSDTNTDELLFGLMGIFIGINVLIMALFIIETVRLKMKTEKSIQWAIFIGWLVVFFGCYVGGQMLNQVGHNVGVADGGDGLPILNWSTIAGDLRIAHFFGLHGIQIIPLFSYMISKKWNLSMKRQIAIITIFGVLYASWIAFTFYQAKQAMPLLHL